MSNSDWWPLALPSNPATQERAAKFVLELGRALHRYGSPAHLLEDALRHLSHRLGVEGHFFTVPTAIIASLRTSQGPITNVIRIDPGDINLEKMALLDRVTRDVISGKVSPFEGERSVKSIVSAKSRYGHAITTLSYSLASASAACFLGGGFTDVAASGFIALLIGVVAIVASRVQAVGRLFEAISAAIAASLAAIVACYVHPFSPSLTTIAALIVLLPGLGLTIGMTELATRNLVSGTARLAGAGTVFLQLGFGVALGSQLARVLPPVTSLQAPETVPAWATWVSLVIAPAAFTVLLRARPRDLPGILLASWVSFGGARLGSLWLGPSLGSCLGALCVGIVSNATSRLGRQPAAITNVPGIILLLPGSMGFRSLSSLLAGDIVSGVDMAVTMTLVAVALVAGLLFANVAFPPVAYEEEAAVPATQSAPGL